MSTPMFFNFKPPMSMMDHDLSESFGSASCVRIDEDLVGDMLREVSAD